MASKVGIFLLGLLLAFLILSALHESEGRRSKRSFSSRRSKSSRSYRSKRVPASKPKPKPNTFHSGVTHSQINKKPNYSFKQKFAVGAAAGFVGYTLLTRPVYGGTYRPYHGASNIAIPKDRALAIKKEEYRVEREDGSRCLNGTLVPYNASDVENVKTKVSYKVSESATTSQVAPIVPYETVHSKTTNITLNAKAINDYITEIETHITFDRSVLKNTTADSTVNCTVLVYSIQAYVVESFAVKSTASLGLFLPAILFNMCFN